MGLKALFTKRKDFLKMLLLQAEKNEIGLQHLAQFIASPTKENSEIISQIEKEADEIRRVLIEDLNRSFVTEVDREDIFALSRSLDDVIDYARTTGEEMLLFEISPDEYLKKIVNILIDASKEITLAIKCLKTHPNVCSQHIIKAKKAENAIEHCYRQALVELFKDGDIKKILKLREIYRHLSNAADRIDEAANIIADISIKIS